MLFHSHRMYYRIWTEEDLAAGIKLWGNPEVMKFIEEPLSDDGVLKSIQAGKRHYQNYGTQLFAMVLKKNDQIIGCCGFSVEDLENKTYEFGIHIMPEYQLKNYGYEAGKAAIAYIKNQASLIIAACHLENKASEQLLLKLGFDYKGNRWFDDTKRYEQYFEKHF